MLMDTLAARGIAIEGGPLLKEAASRGHVDLVAELIRRGLAEGDGSAELAEARMAFLREIRRALKPIARMRAGTPRAGSINPDDAKMVAGVLGCLRADGPDEVRALAADCLGLLGPVAAGAIPDLEAAVKRGPPDVGKAATKALRLIGGRA